MNNESMVKPKNGNDFFKFFLFIFISLIVSSDMILIRIVLIMWYMVYPIWDTFKVLFTTLTSIGNIMTKIIFIKYIVLSILVVLTFLFIRTRLYCKNKLKIRRFKTSSSFFMIIVRKLRLRLLNIIMVKMVITEEIKFIINILEYNFVSWFLALLWLKNTSIRSPDNKMLAININSVFITSSFFRVDFNIITLSF